MRLPFLPDEYERLLWRARRQEARRVLVAWNRALGDVALAICGFVDLVGRTIPGAEVTILTRPDLEEACGLVPGVREVLVGPHWTREANRAHGTPSAADVARELQRMGREGSFDLVIAELRAGRWWRRQLGRYVTRLRWEPAWQARGEALVGRAARGRAVALHVDSETGHLYGYVKNWPRPYWVALIQALLARGQTPVLLGLRQAPPLVDDPRVLDLRGKTTLREALAVILTCGRLVAPDSGLLTFAYFLETVAPLRAVSLWATTRFGILQAGVLSPNPALEHHPLVGAGGDISTITVEQVLAALGNGAG